MVLATAYANPERYLARGNFNWWSYNQFGIPSSQVKLRWMYRHRWIFDCRKGYNYGTQAL